MKALLTSFDLLLIVLTFLTVVIGMARQWSFWHQKKPAGVTGDWKGLMEYLLAHRNLIKRPAVGWSHLAVFWGVVIPLIVIILAQFGFVIPHMPATLL